MQELGVDEVLGRPRGQRVVCIEQCNGRGVIGVYHPLDDPLEGLRTQGSTFSSMAGFDPLPRLRFGDRFPHPQTRPTIDVSLRGETRPL